MNNNQDDTKPKKWSKPKILTWVSNITLIISIIVFVGISISWGVTFKNIYDEIKNECDTLSTPYDIENLSYSDAMKIYEDNINWTYDEYNQVLLKKYHEQIDGIEKYRMTHTIRLYYDDISATKTFQIDTILDLYVNTDSCQGNIIVGTNADNEMKLPIYVSRQKDTDIVYIQHQNKWIKYEISKDQESFINLSLQKTLELVEKSCEPNPLSIYTSDLQFDMNQFNYGPYKYIFPAGCSESVFRMGSFTYRSGARILLHPGDIEFALDYAGLKQIAEQKNDKVINHLLDNYYISHGLIFSTYHADEEAAVDIAIPEEALAAEYATQEDMEAIMNDVIAFYDKEAEHAREQ